MAKEGLDRRELPWTTTLPGKVVLRIEKLAKHREKVYRNWVQWANRQEDFWGRGMRFSFRRVGKTRRIFEIRREADSVCRLSGRERAVLSRLPISRKGRAAWWHRPDEQQEEQD